MSDEKQNDVKKVAKKRGRKPAVNKELKDNSVNKDDVLQLKEELNKLKEEHKAEKEILKKALEDKDRKLDAVDKTTNPQRLAQTDRLAKSADNTQKAMFLADKRVKETLKELFNLAPKRFELTHKERRTRLLYRLGGRLITLLLKHQQQNNIMDRRDWFVTSYCIHPEDDAKPTPKDMIKITLAHNCILHVPGIHRYVQCKNPLQMLLKIKFNRYEVMGEDS